ncbi:hypothetical protein LCGC14_1454710 [marine sediment metagenome]|uniref:Adenylyltransferase AadA C-terminal domain-containing protein n=1 Tax=marine sediment metagenome TaxID=412755 RepID=A0A0F9K323_9ZZZZ
MGSYGISKEEMIEAIVEALDKLEGDFTQEQLFSVLKMCRNYPYVSDKVINDGYWRKLLKKKQEMN